MKIFKKSQPEKTDKADKVKIKKNIDKRNKNLKALSITSTILFLALLLVFNIVFDKVLSSRLKWDWSTGSQYTIGDVSKEILKSMTTEVQIIGLFDKDADTTYQDVQPMLDEYAKLSDGKVTVRYVDPDKDPNIVKEVDPEGYMNPDANTFVVYCPSTGKAKNLAYGDIFAVDYDTSSGYYQQYVTGVTAEQSISGAIKYVQSKTTPVIYFTSGHEELDYAATYKTMVSIMKNNNYDVKSLDLFDLDAIPDDCATLVIASPQKDLSAAESKVISTYLQKGGGLMVAVDYNINEYPELNALLSDFNLEISNNKIREGNADYRYKNDPYTLRANAPTCSITTDAVEGLTLMDNVRGINELKTSKDGITVEAVLTTTDKGVAEANGDENQSSEPATQNVAMISENTRWVDGSTVTKASRVMVVGSSSIFSDDMLNISSQLYNAYIFYTGVKWLNNDNTTDSLYIPAKATVSYAVTAGSNSTNVVTAVFVMLIIPCLLLLTALFVYRRRRHL